MKFDVSMKFDWKFKLCVQEHLKMPAKYMYVIVLLNTHKVKDLMCGTVECDVEVLARCESCLCDGIL